jgi:hypothetical protein
MPRKADDRPRPPQDEDEEARTQRRDRLERSGDPSAFEKSWHGTDGASGHGSYVGEDLGRDTRESDAPEVTGRTPYVGTRMGDWDEGERTSGDASEERGKHASSYGDDQTTAGGTSPQPKPLARRSAGSGRRRADRRKPR